MNITFTLEKCKTKAGYAAKLPSSRKLNLAQIKQHFEVILETPILLVIKEQGLEIVVHGYGELLFKNGTESQKELMRKIAEKVYEVGKVTILFRLVTHSTTTLSSGFNQL